jgi:hypothetical protein
MHKLYGPQEAGTGRHRPGSVLQSDLCRDHFAAQLWIETLLTTPTWKRRC